MNEGETEDILKACAGQEDEEGFIKYESKLHPLLNTLWW